MNETLRWFCLSDAPEDWATRWVDSIWWDADAILIRSYRKIFWAAPITLEDIPRVICEAGRMGFWLDYFDRLRGIFWAPFIHLSGRFEGVNEGMSICDLVKCVGAKNIIFQGANFDGVNLCETNLHGANLSEVSFQKANLYGADVSGANMSGADLRGANMGEMNFRGANMSGADLRGAFYISLSERWKKKHPITREYIKSRGVLSCEGAVFSEQPSLCTRILDFVRGSVGGILPWQH